MSSSFLSPHFGLFITLVEVNLGSRRFVGHLRTTLQIPNLPSDSYYLYISALDVIQRRPLKVVDVDNPFLGRLVQYLLVSIPDNTNNCVLCPELDFPSFLSFKMTFISLIDGSLVFILVYLYWMQYSQEKPRAILILLIWLNNKSSIETCFGISDHIITFDHI